MCSVRAISGPRPAFSRRTHRTTPAVFTPSITARMQEGCGVCFVKLTPRLRLCPQGGHIMPHSRDPPFALRPGPVKGAAAVPPASSFACARIRQVDKLYHILRAHATPSATWAGARRPFRPSHAAPAMRGIPPHPPGPASLFACVHQAGGARSIRPLFHMQPAPAGRTKVRERASRHQPARRAAPANRPRLYRAIQTRRPAHVIIKVGRHGRPERGKGR